MIPFLIAFAVCCAVGTGVALVEAKTKQPVARFYAWLAAILFLSILGAAL
jgi:hypothetical protein